ncbi:hypothetical protein EHO57_13975 [Leptospira langatensis]|uniref:Uncharacterized protein n=1 Tax=Leptospira langatensis TaxID=2484983 RepID=A0A5R2ATB2_9LEPT|nr:hypothetical protein [Leptospira langatensis]TGJ99914.1 hypothetical protein EHO57_13975 [Leptospira langatensis]
MQSNQRSGGAPHPGLVAQKRPDALGRNITHWVKPGDVETPRERKVLQAKEQRNRIQHTTARDPKVEKQIQEMTDRHKQFEEEARKQRRTYGSGPQVPKPGMIMRVYAKGKVNVGGMLAKIKEIAEDGKTAICELTSGKTYPMPLDQLQFAKSYLDSSD